MARLASRPPPGSVPARPASAATGASGAAPPPARDKPPARAPARAPGACSEAAPAGPFWPTPSPPLAEPAWPPCLRPARAAPARRPAEARSARPAWGCTRAPAADSMLREACWTLWPAPSSPRCASKGPAQRMMRSGIWVTREKSRQVAMPTTAPTSTTEEMAAVTPKPPSTSNTPVWASKKGTSRAPTRDPETLRTMRQRNMASTRSRGRRSTERKSA